VDYGNGWLFAGRRGDILDEGWLKSMNELGWRRRIGTVVSNSLRPGLTWRGIAATKAADLRLEFIALGPTACCEVTGESGNLAGVLMRALLTDIEGLRGIAT